MAQRIIHDFREWYGKAPAKDMVCNWFDGYVFALHTNGLISDAERVEIYGAIDVIVKGA